MGMCKVVSRGHLSQPTLIQVTGRSAIHPNNSIPISFNYIDTAFNNGPCHKVAWQKYRDSPSFLHL